MDISLAFFLICMLLTFCGFLFTALVVNSFPKPNEDLYHKHMEYTHPIIRTIDG